MLRVDFLGRLLLWAGRWACKGKALSASVELPLFVRLPIPSHFFARCFAPVEKSILKSLPHLGILARIYNPHHINVELDLPSDLCSFAPKTKVLGSSVRLGDVGVV